MTHKEREIITDLSKCDFRQIHAYYVQQNEDRKNRSKEEKKALKETNEALIAEYGWCNIDGHKQRIGNFKIEPPGLFRGRGEHPKQGMLKKRIMPEDVIINCSKDSAIPKPPDGHKWKEVGHSHGVGLVKVVTSVGSGVSAGLLCTLHYIFQCNCLSVFSVSCSFTETSFKGGEATAE